MHYRVHSAEFGVSAIMVSDAHTFLGQKIKDKEEHWYKHNRVLATSVLGPLKKNKNQVLTSKA